MEAEREGGREGGGRREGGWVGEEEGEEQKQDQEQGGSGAGRGLRLPCRGLAGPAPLWLALCFGNRITHSKLGSSSEVIR